MEIIFLLIPLSLVLVALALWAFFWAVKNGQFDDLESPGMDILEDEVSAQGEGKQPEGRSSARPPYGN